MADEVTAPANTAAAIPVEETTGAADAAAQPVVAEAKPAEGGVVATSGVAEEVSTNETSQGETTAAEQDTSADAQAEPAPQSDDAEAAPTADEPAVNGTPAPKKATNGKRKSVGATSEGGKNKTPAKKKKKPAPELRLDASSGDMYMVAMRGYQPWPVIVCDEEMLPESLLSKRPVSAKRIDGTYREDFLEGGKNAKDRRYPVMFLGTNEFAWQVNTDLLTFDIEDVKRDVDSGNQAKKNKALWEAYQIAAEGHDLAYFKQLLLAHEQAMQEDAEQREQKEIQKKEKADKAAKRKSTAADESNDVEMEDAQDDAAPSAKKAKGSKKRKKGDESDGENEKPAKTPKTKLKLTTKTPKDSAAKPKKEPKSKKGASEEAQPSPPEEPPMTEEEKLQKREKQVLYLRHRLQKGFLSRDQVPKDEDMESMSEYLKELEKFGDLEADIIRKTKVHKVLKAIIKLEGIPREEEYHFKQRSSDLLGKWSGALATENEPAAATPVGEAATNGVNHDGDTKESEPKKESTSAANSEKNEAPGPVDDKSADKNGDVAMSDVDKEVIKDAPAVKADPVEGDTETVGETSPTTTSADAVAV